MKRDRSVFSLFVIFVVAIAPLSVWTSAGAQDNGFNLKGKRVAILVADGFEHSELAEPKLALESAGAKTTILSPEKSQVKAWKDKNWGASIPVDVQVDAARADQFDALLLPGGVMNPDTLRMNPTAVKFVKAMGDSGKPIAAICHGPWTLVEADLVRGKKLTSWPSLQADIRNAGGSWMDNKSLSIAAL